MSSWTWPHGWTSWVCWNALWFSVAFLLNSFIEWGAHRFVLHGTRFGRFAYDLHHVGHHGMFKADDTYHALNDEMRNHVVFVWRDYALFLLVTTPIWVAVELVSGRPILVGGILATLAGLQMFNSLHWRYHVPSDTAFQRSRFFRSLKDHHRRHHADTSKNYNVFFFPIADMCLGTFARPSRSALPPGNPPAGQ